MKKESEDQRSVLTKDKAFKAAVKVVDKLKKLHGLKNSEFLEKHFAKTWEDHDEKHVNFLATEDAYTFMKDLIDEEDD